VAILTVELIVVSGALGLLMGVWLIGRPLNRLIDKTRRIGGGDLSGRLSLKGRDELSELAVALNDMCDELAVAQDRVRSETEARIATMEQMRHMDRLRTVGRLAAGIAHELGTPLNVISGRADLVATGRLPPPEVEKSARIIKEQSERMTRIIRQLLDFARRRSPRKTRVDLSECVRRTLEMLAPLGKRSKADLTATGIDSPVLTDIDAGQIEQVLVNLVVNGLQAMPTGGTLEVVLLPDGPRPQGCESSETEFVCMRVKDEGEGIRPEDLTHLFDPFFTTKQVGEGTGLGLSIAYGIVTEHGGYIEAESELGKGSCFSVFLPKED
jgi:signal transduction histidine kinase